VPSESWKDKLDVRLRARLAAADAATGLEPMTLLILIDGDGEALARHGFVAGSTAGGITLGQAAISAIPAIAMLPEVRFIELSRGLSLDDPEG